MSVIIDHLTKRIGRQTILRDISLSIPDGEVVALLGPNGAGKSTLMKILVGLWEPTSGSVAVPASHGYLPEQNPLYDEMYVREYLMFMAGLASGKLQVASDKLQVASDKDYVESLIERVGLMPEANKKIGQLSKGYRQRVGLAAALIGDPELLILDEPTTGLDPNQLVEIRELIKSIGRDHTVILSTHIMQEVREMCSRVLILNHGELQADVPADQVADLEALFREKTA